MAAATITTVSQVVVASPAAAQSSGSCDATSSLGGAPPLLLPAWADGAGWSNADQYSTILAGDLDGDGTSELMGRNSSNLEVYQWAPNYLPRTPLPPAPADPTDPADDQTFLDYVEPESTTLPRPHQWAATLAPGPAFPEAPTNTDPNSWADPSFYRTFQLADIDGDGVSELFARYASGIQVYAVTNRPTDNPVRAEFPSYDWTTFAGPPLSDASGWYPPQYYETIDHANVDGAPGDEIVARGTGGLQVWKSGPGNTFSQIATGGSAILTDAQGWGGSSPAYYQSIQFADITGDGRAEVLALGEGMQGSQNGLNAWTYEPSSDSWQPLAGGPIPWTGQSGWNNPNQFLTIHTANLLDAGPNARPAPAVVIGRSAQGLDAWSYNGSGWTHLVDTPSLLANNDTSTNPPTNFTQAPYYTTIQAADVLGRETDQVLARKTDGLHVITYDATTRSFLDNGSTLGQFSDANGWNNEVRYPTIQSVDVYTRRPASGSLVIGRDQTGVRSYRLDPATGVWANPSTPFPVWTSATWPAALPAFPASPYAPTFPDTGPGRAYGYINDWMASPAYPPDGGGLGFAPGVAGDPGTTILSSFLDVDTNLGQIAANLTASLNDDANSLQPEGLNITRGTWTGVNQDLLYWTTKVQQVNGILGVGATGANLQTLIDQSMISQVEGVYSVGSIEQYFSHNSSFIAALASLIAGAIAGASGFPNLSTDAEKAAATFLFSMMGSSVTAGSAFLPNPYGSVQAEASNLENIIATNFCAAIQFLNNAQSQIVQDEGLLATMGQLTDPGGPLSFTGNQYANGMSLATQQRAIWIFQQFTQAKNSGWQAGYCNFTEAHNCGVGFGTAERHGVSFSDSYYVYQFVSNDCCGTPNCAGKVSDSGWALLTDPAQYDQSSGAITAGNGQGLGANLNQMFAPRLPPNRGVSTYGGPTGDKIGLSGWNLDTHHCGQ